MNLLFQEKKNIRKKKKIYNFNFFFIKKIYSILMEGVSPKKERDILRLFSDDNQEAILELL